VAASPTAEMMAFAEQQKSNRTFGQASSLAYRSRIKCLQLVAVVGTWAKGRMKAKRTWFGNRAVFSAT
jgi:hypothetical protein